MPPPSASSLRRPPACHAARHMGTDSPPLSPSEPLLGDKGNLELVTPLLGDFLQRKLGRRAKHHLLRYTSLHEQFLQRHEADRRHVDRLHLEGRLAVGLELGSRLGLCCLGLHVRDALCHPLCLILLVLLLLLLCLPPLLLLDLGRPLLLLRFLLLRLRLGHDLRARLLGCGGKRVGVAAFLLFHSNGVYDRLLVPRLEDESRLLSIRVQPAEVSMLVLALGIEGVDDLVAAHLHLTALSKALLRLVC
mmetsp:Transcript_2739/g.7599  ORF Transcript_2739/g.7599 Transcript_2739/m.7599 type:complete len:248 (+) Transcript_2739:306-1049(+)